MRGRRRRRASRPAGSPSGPVAPFQELGALEHALQRSSTTRTRLHLVAPCQSTLPRPSQAGSRPRPGILPEPAGRPARRPADVPVQQATRRPSVHRSRGADQSIGDDPVRARPAGSPAAWLDDGPRRVAGGAGPSRAKDEPTRRPGTRAPTPMRVATSPVHQPTPAARDAHDDRSRERPAAVAPEGSPNPRPRPQAPGSAPPPGWQPIDRPAREAAIRTTTARRRRHRTRAPMRRRPDRRARAAVRRHRTHVAPSHDLQGCARGPDRGRGRPRCRQPVQVQGPGAEGVTRPPVERPAAVAVRSPAANPRGGGHREVAASGARAIARPRRYGPRPPAGGPG